MTCLLAANMACSSSEESSVERPVRSCAEVCFDNLSRGLVCFIIPICNRNITCLVRNLFPQLSCDDIPGSIISKADLHKCKKNELKLWLSCRGLRFRSADTSAELVSR